MLAPPPLPRNLEASFRDVDAARPEVRASSLEDLARHAVRDPAVRARALAPIERALRDDFAGVRSAAAVALADLRASEALPALLVAIEDGDPHVRQMALTALGEIGDRRAGQRLRRALSDPRPEVRYQAIIAYTRVLASPSAGREERSPTENDAAEAVRALAVAMSDEDDSVRYIALRLLEERVDAGARGGLDDVVTEAKRLASEPDAHVATVAAIVLAKLGDPDAVRAVARVVLGETLAAGARPALEDEREAVELAGALGLRETIPALERRAFGVRRFVSDTCAYSATIALARLGHARARDELLRGLESGKRSTREASVVAVGRARMVEARGLLERLAEDDVDPALVARALDDLAAPPEAETAARGPASAGDEARP